MIEIRNLPSEYQRLAEKYVKHNRNLAGPNNKPHPLKEFKFFEGFCFANIMTNRVWKVTRNFPQDHQVFMKTLDGQHQCLVDDGVKMRLPEGLDRVI